MLKTLSRKTMIGPDDDGRQMSLDEFDLAKAREGYRYELNKGIIEVTDVPNIGHGRIVNSLRRQLEIYDEANEGVINFVASASDAKILLASVESERHPDLTVYLTPPPGEGAEIWSQWIPEIVIEVVSRRSIKRDYQDKPAEYLSFGVKEYWIVDGLKNQMTVLSRWRGQWKEKILKPTQKYTTRHLPGFTLDLKRVFAVNRLRD